MSVYDLFRGFFGFGGERLRPRDPFFGGIMWDDDEDDDNDDGGPSFEARGFEDFGFGFTFGPGGMRFRNAFGFEELFRDFNDLFSEMGTLGLPSRPFVFPGVEAPPPTDPSLTKRQTLRDSMLKYPDNHRPSARALEESLSPPAPEKRPWRSFQGLHENQPAPANIPKEDGDLDLRVKSEGLETILPSAQPRSYFKSVSITKVVAPDGTIEERRTVRDNQGHEETVVTHRGGGEPILDGGRLGGPGDTRCSLSHLGSQLRLQLLPCI
ncbi:HCLS1-associated protein X-1 isoform X2 [Sceloporus undulatus]|uniref:HCLS1-associated protein X-1 isoform X2 n=1 Tax=Sceloporus undulatus TaxID=8520 RepID=UPI001C4C3693|nr:HCLS1-associated protein X-1 isoform X2 [Sceloporus undulatus]